MILAATRLKVLHIFVTSVLTKSQISVRCTLQGGGNQAYSRLSTLHGHITDCKLDSVVYAGVGVVIEYGPVLFRPNDLRPTISFFGAKPPIQFRHR